MLRANLFHIYQHFLNSTDSKENVIELKDNFSENQIHEFEKPDDLLEAMLEDASMLNLSFIGYNLDKEDIIDLLHSPDFPLMILLKREDYIEPVIIQFNGKEFEINPLILGNSYKSSDLNSILNLLYYDNNSVNTISALPICNYYANALSQNKTKSIFNRLLAILKVDKKDIINIFFYAVVGGLVGLILPLGIQSLINFLQMGQYTASGFVLIFLIIFAVFASGVLQIIQLWIMELIQQRIFARASFDFIGKVTALKSKIIKQQYPPELMNRFFDIVAIQKSLSSILIDFSASAIQIIFGLTLLALYHPVFIAFSLVLALVIYLMIKYTGNKGLESSLKESKYKYNIVSWLQQVASARETFRLQTSKNLPVQKMDEYVSHYLTARKKHFRILITQYMYFLGFSVLITGGLLIAGYFLLMSKSITLGQLVASEIIILLIVNSIEKLIHKIESIYDILTSVEKVSQVLTMEVEVQKQELRINLSSDNLLTIEGLKLANEQDIISFNIKSGEIKNIYLNDRLNLNAFTEILLKEVDYTGSIKLNSIELNKLKSAFIQNNLALYTNQEKLFDGTIRENICFDNHQDNDELLLNLISFFGFEQIINDLSSGLNTEIVGGNYSWGNNFQRQLILLRSFFKKPKLLIIDELLLPKHVELIKLKKYINSALPNSMVIIISKEIIDEEVK